MARRANGDRLPICWRKAAVEIVWIVSVPDGEDDSDDDRRRQRPAAANSLPRLPTTTAPGAQQIYKAHSLHQFAASSSAGVKSARYRPPGYTSAAAPAPAGRSQAAVAPPPRRLQDAARRNRSSQLSSPPATVLGESALLSH
ncbi:hypothetical protein LSTR_LSTR016278 [Laodelphax striatellus]|uniref:Uncharacterized protein n=1 Tax=Laodelphax striatellus TaxID=195883 RepID=A0A482XES0_LAOST|nr:hypothetical protein LSTR_LSTR016278 [Laodelphax striatellus]